MPWSDNLQPGSPAYLIASSINDRIRVMAGPGTGKSFAMKRRVARLLEVGVSPRSILPVTFTRVAAEDLHRELVGMNVPGCDQIEGTTLHSLALRILVRNHVLHATGRMPRPLNDFESKPLEADLQQEYGGVRSLRKKIKAYEAAWARLQHEEPGFVRTPDDAAFRDDLIGWLIFHRAMLIGEVIPQLYDYLRSNPAAAERQEFSHILVDEFQDLNRAEQGVIELLSDVADVCIVGDDDQSIYSFKYAHPEGIRDWSLLHQNADDLTISECRRCPTRVVEMANLLIARNTGRPVHRTLVPMASNGAGVVRIIQYANLHQEIAGVVNIVVNLIEAGTRPGDILILAQRGVIGTPIFESLVGRRIPARSYYAEAELSDEDAQRRFALLKLFVDREDRIALRWLLGLGSNNWLAGNYRRVREHCESSGASPWQCLESLEANTVRIPHSSMLVSRFTALKAELDQLENAASSGGLRAVLDALFPAANTRVRDLRALALGIIEPFDLEDRQLFLRELASAIAKPEIPSEIEDVRIMSLHKSKGLSAPVTIIAGCVAGLLPQEPEPELSLAERAASLEEQRRLFYVGITRVKAAPDQNQPGTLILTYSQRMPLASAMGSGIRPARMDYDQAVMNASRFIQEMAPAAPLPERG